MVNYTCEEKTEVNQSSNELSSVTEFQVEMELKSGYKYRPNLKRIADDMEQEVKGLVATRESKYSRGISFVGKGVK